MEAGVVAGWNDFLIAAASALGALAGLVFVALSINLSRIIEIPGVVSRAAETVILLAGGLIGSLIALVPGLSREQLGFLLLLVWLPVWGVPSFSQFKEIAGRKYMRPMFAATRVTLHQTAAIPLLVASLALEGYVPGGLRWLAAALILSMVAALVNAWVLLVEILR